MRAVLTGVRAHSRLTCIMKPTPTTAKQAGQEFCDISRDKFREIDKLVHTLSKAVDELHAKLRVRVRVQAPALARMMSGI